MIKISRIYTRKNPQKSKKFPHFVFPKKGQRKWKSMELASYNNLLGCLKEFQRTENKRMMMIQISSNIHPHHLLHLYHHRRQRRRRPPRRCRNRRLPRRRRRPLCSCFPRLRLLLVKFPPFSLLSLFCDFLFSWQSEICNCIMLSHFLLLAGKFKPNSWRNCVVVCLDSL